MFLLIQALTAVCFCFMIAIGFRGQQIFAQHGSEELKASHTLWYILAVAVFYMIATSLMVAVSKRMEHKGVNKV